SAATIQPVSSNAERAGPVSGQHAAPTPPARNTSGATTQQVSTSPARVPAQTPARTQSGSATTQHASGAQPNLILPQTAGSLALTQTGAQTPESTDPNAVTAVRRERAAGPDQ